MAHVYVCSLRVLVEFAASSGGGSKRTGRTGGVGVQKSENCVL